MSARPCCLAVPLLLLLAAAAPCTHAQAAPAPRSVLDYVQARPDLRLTDAVLGYLPHLQLLLADPGFKGTFFAPSDDAWMGWLGVKTYAAALKDLKRQDMFGDNDSQYYMATSLYYERGAWYRWLWRSALMHIIPDKVLLNSQLKTGLELKPLFYNQTYDMLVVDSTGPVSFYAWSPDGEGTSKIVRSARVTPTAMVHTVTGVFLPEIAPVDSYDLNGLYDRDLWYKLVNASSHRTLFHGPYQPHREPHMTVMMPTDKAINAYLDASNTTLEAVLADQTWVDRIVGAHVVPSQVLFTWDIMNIAAINTTVTTLAGTQLRVENDYVTVWLVGADGVRAGMWAWVDVGGNEGACRSEDTDIIACGGLDEYPSVAHEVDRVLL